MLFNARSKGSLDLYQRRFVVFSTVSPTTGFDLWLLPFFGDRKAFPFLQTQFTEIPAEFSPNGRWIAYGSNESGRFEVYVVPFPGPGGKRQISVAGGNLPRWRRDGKELFYLVRDNKLMVAAVNGEGSAFDVGAARSLFETRAGGPPRSVYDVSADGQRFLVNTVVEEAAAPITLVVNWPALLKK